MYFLDKTLNKLTDIIYLIFTLFLKILTFNNLNLDSNTSKKRNTIIICNGPSLSDSISWIQKKRKSSDLYVSHYFARYKLFFKLKPEFYIFVDSLFWRKDVHTNYKKENEKLFDILEKINWKMVIIVPSNGLKSLRKRIKNKNITFQNIVYCPKNFNSESLTLFCLKKKIISPICSSAAVLALWHAILRDRKNIFLFGVDFSQFKEFSVDQITNEVTIENTHFYKNSEAENSINKRKKFRRFQLHMSLYKISVSFYQMYLLSRLALIKDIKVINGSRNSYLNYFPRLKK